VTDNTALATSWLEQLAARGITARLVNGRIRYYPAKSYGQLTGDEIVFARDHRAAIKAVITAGVSFDVVRVAPTVETTPAPAPICTFCMRECVGPSHPAFATFHALDPQEIRRQCAEQRERDYHEWELRKRFNLPSPTWDI
jgi:hypothetical protein